MKTNVNVIVLVVLEDGSVVSWGFYRQVFLSASEGEDDRRKPYLPDEEEISPREMRVN